MPGVIDLECNLGPGENSSAYRQALQGPPGNPVPDRLQRPPGYGFDNYDRIFKSRTEHSTPDVDSTSEAGIAALLADMDRAGVAVGVIGGAPNRTIARIARAHPDRFIGLAAVSPLDGMRGVREFESLVRDHGIGGLRVVALYNSIPASDRR